MHWQPVCLGFSIEIGFQRIVGILGREKNRCCLFVGYDHMKLYGPTAAPLLSVAEIPGGNIGHGTFKMD